MSIKSARGFILMSNELVTWYFHEAAFCSAGMAMTWSDLTQLDKLSILKTSADGTKCYSTNWPNEVTNVFALAAKLREIEV